MPHTAELINWKLDPLQHGGPTGSACELVEPATGVRRQFLCARDYFFSMATNDSTGKRSGVRERSRVPCAVGLIWIVSSMRVTLAGEYLRLNLKSHRSHMDVALVSSCQNEAGN